MEPSYVIFTCDRGGTCVTMRVNAYATGPELVEAFAQFMLALGYQPDTVLESLQGYPL